MRRILPLTLALALLPCLAPPVAAESQHEGDLVAWMGRLQYYAHKLGLAIDARNRALQGYYIHEVEEVIEQIETIEALDGIEIGNLVKANLVPAFETLEGAIEIGDHARVSETYDGLIAACNTCHQAAKRPYLQVVRRRDNPYIQDFTPLP